MKKHISIVSTTLISIYLLVIFCFGMSCSKFYYNYYGICHRGSTCVNEIFLNDFDTELPYHNFSVDVIIENKVFASGKKIKDSLFDVHFFILAKIDTMSSSRPDSQFFEHFEISNVRMTIQSTGEIISIEQKPDVWDFSVGKRSKSINFGDHIIPSLADTIHIEFVITNDYLPDRIYRREKSITLWLVEGYDTGPPRWWPNP